MPKLLVLASGSAYRAALLRRLGVAFEVGVPGIDEASQPGESAAALCMRLALAKARAVARLHDAASVIGSDQVLECDGVLLGKPGDHARAHAQLHALGGKEVRFHTAVCLLCPDGRTYEHIDVCAVRFRNLDDAFIDAYLRFDQPYDCAGSFKSEAAGAALCEWIRGDDPTALVGLPLQVMSGWLRSEGISLFAVAPG